MNMNHIDPLMLTIWAVVIGVSFVLMLAGVLICLVQLRAYRQELVTRLTALRIHKMLDRIGVSLSRYLRKAQPMDVEKHLLVCQSCAKTDICDEYLEHGKRIEERTFCPNFGELISYQRCQKEQQPPAGPIE